MDVNLSQATTELGAVGAMLWAAALSFLPRFGAALLILVAGFLLAGWLARAVRGGLHRSRRVDQTVVPVASAAARYSVLVIVLVAALGQIGVQTTSLLAVLGAVGLAIGLALQGTLSNVAAGIMLLWLRPFGVGDSIETSNVAGTVDELGLFNTRVTTWDGVFKFVPNAQLWNTTLTNYSRNPTRLILIQFGIAYEDDVATGRRVLREVAEAHPNVLKEPPPEVVPLSLGDSAVVLQLRAWAPNALFSGTQWDLTEAGKKRLEEAGITIPFPQRVIHVVGSEGGGPAGPRRGTK